MKIVSQTLQKVDTVLTGFEGRTVPAEGTITLPVIAGSAPRCSRINLIFTVVRISSAYNAILGRPGLCALRAVESVYYLAIKFPTPYGVGKVCGDQAMARQCYMVACRAKRDQHPDGLPVDRLEVRDQPTEEGGEPAEDLIPVPLHDGDPEHIVRIGSGLDDATRYKLTLFLQENADVFAWAPADIPGVDPEIVMHHLKVDPGHRPVKQKRRGFAPERQEAIAEEVQKLLKANFIREVNYPEWLANAVLVKKANGKWRMCIDFTDLNKACPKDSFPLPRIDQLVDATAGHELLTFMDAFSGYNQIPMAPEDEDKTAFITDRGLFCYRVMPFGLKNAGATYQRLVNQMFRDQIGRNMEVYVDDMLVKSVAAQDHVQDLKEAFSVLRRYRMKLNPAKCAFGVKSGRFLGFMVSARGIEANPEKILALKNMVAPRTIKEVQQLTGRIAALSRFVSKSAERCLPFFQTLKKPKDFCWTPECQMAFDDLKTYLGAPPLLSKPKEGERLFLYLAISSSAIGSVLVREEDRTQKPVYYVSRVLQNAEARYTRLEKFAFALIISVRKLRPYFQAHSVTVLTDQPLRSVLHRPDTSGRMAKWALELFEFDLMFCPRPSIKAQVLADFVTECTIPMEELPEGDLTLEDPESQWTVYVDGAANTNGSGAGIVVISPEGWDLQYALRFGFPTTNNEAEYEALIAGLAIAREMGVQHLKAYSDSRLVVGHVTGEYEAKEDNMRHYLQKVKELASGLCSFHIEQIPRDQNMQADQLSKLATSLPKDLSSRVFLEIQDGPSIGGAPSVLQVAEEPCWMDSLTRYLTDGSLPEDRAEARRLRYRAARFILHQGKLYKRGFSQPLLKCLRPTEAEYALREVHEGICGNHLGARTLSHKVLRQGYYWPTIEEDAKNLVRKCDRCQRHANIQRLPSAPLTPLNSPWPFAQWGIDIVGPFPPATGGRKFLLVAIDYFTKWVEAEPLAKITEAKVKDFVWKSIVCRFGLPKVIISDNGRQFSGIKLAEYCQELGIRQCFTSVGHPQANGEAEVANRILLHGIKTRLGRAKG